MQKSSTRAAQADPSEITLTGGSSYQTRRLVLASLVRFLEIFGDPWSVLVLRDAFLGVNRFDEFQKRLNINRQTLSARLKGLIDNEIFVKAAYQDRPPRYEYVLTAKSRDLYWFALAIWNWQTVWTPREHHILPQTLRHKDGGELLAPEMVCDQCLGPITAESVECVAMGEVDDLPKLTGRGRRWSGASDKRRSDPAQQILRATTIIGDRWVNLIIAAMLLGIRSFDELVRTIGIATNILSHRLTALTEAGLIDDPIYNSSTATFEYQLSDAGRDLLPMFIAMAQWSDHWLRPDNADLTWRHKTCGKPFRAIMTDRSCGKKISLTSVEFDDLAD